jgi:HTH-type transcriptional regulator / antitoxin HipB
MKKNTEKLAPEPVRQITRALAIARSAKGITQVELARLMGVPQSQISKLETGKVDARVSTLVQVARLLDLEMVLVPRPFIPVVRKIIQAEEDESPFLYRLSE